MNSSSKLNASNAAPALLGALLMSSTLPAQAEQVAEHSRKESTTLETVQVLGDEEDGFNVALTEDIIDKQQATDTPQTIDNAQTTTTIIR